MKFDDVVAELGEFGRYQKVLYFVTCLVAIPAGMQALASVFVQAEPDHRCAIPGLENDTYESQGAWHDALVRAYIPWDNDSQTFDDCAIWADPGSSDNGTESCSSYVYSTEIYTATFVTEENLVCDDYVLVTTVDMIYMSGMLAGSLVSGILSDRFGRKKVLVVSTFFQLGTSVGLTWINSYALYAALKFCIAAFGTSMFITAFVIGVELVGPSMRCIAGIVIEMFWCLGLFIQTGLAYGLRDWRDFQLACSAPTVLFLLLFVLVLPESARWLVQTGKKDEAAKVIETVARRNGVTLSEKAKSLQDIEGPGESESIWRMFTYGVLVARCLIVFYIWFVASMVYYGLSLNVDDLVGDTYLNFFLSALVEMASYIFCLFVLERTGRKFMQCSSMMLGGLACAATIFPVLYGGEGLGWINTTLSLIGKFGVSAGFAVIYIFSAELFPTTMRNSGLGLCSVAARVGGILAPYIGDLNKTIEGDIGTALPLLIFGALSVVAGGLALILPETTGKELPGSAEEARDFGRDEKEPGKIAGKNSYNFPQESNGVASSGLKSSSKKKEDTGV